MMRLTGCAAYAWVTCAVLCVVGSVRGMDGGALPPETSIRLAFRGATIDDVLDSLSRMSGLPVVLDSEVPAGTIDFVSPEDHSLESALRVLNTVLQSRDVNIRVVDGMLHLEKLDDMQRQDLPTFVGTLPTDVTPDTLVTVVRPLESAMAEPIAERLSQMVGQYGAVVAMVGQNAVVITETASNARRLLRMLDALDRQDPDGLIEVFQVKNVAASSLVKPLTQLMTIKVEKYIPGKKGKLQKVEETSLAGLTFAADDHAGLIIAKGSQSSLTKLGEVVRMLDVPGGAGGARTVRTIPLAVLSPTDAVKRLKSVVQAMPEASRPQLVALPERSSVVITGPSNEVDELVAVLTAIEGNWPQSEAVAMELLPLESAEPKAVQTALMGILSPAQRARVKIGIAPDGQSLLLSGPSDDVAAVSRMAEALDLGGADVPAIRTLRLRPGSLSEVMQAYTTLAQTHELPSEVEMAVDPDTGVIRLVGKPADVSAMASLLQSLTETVVEERETKQFVLRHVRPSRIGRIVAASAKSLLTPSDGTPWTVVDVKDVDSLDVLLVTAAPREMDTISSIIDSLDRAVPTDSIVRMMQLQGAPTSVIDQADAAFLEMGGGGFGITRPRVELDSSGDRIVLSGSNESVALYEQALRRYLDLSGPARATRVLTLQFASPLEMATLLSDLANTRGSLLADGSMLPSIEAFDEVNGLLVTGTDRQHQAIRSLLQTLDVADPADSPPLRILQVKVADAGGLARTLTAQYAARSARDRSARPVRITADVATGTLLVSVHADLLPEIEAIVEELNTVERPEIDGREIRIFALKVANADHLSRTIEQMFPQPPAPVDRRGRPLVHLQGPREVLVRADRGTNSLIIEAPLRRMASLEELVSNLDRSQRDQGEIRTYSVDRKRLNSLVSMLRQLDAQGMLLDEPDARQAELTMTPEILSGTLVVSGPPQAFDRIEQLIDEFDAATPSAPRADLRIIPVQNGDARAMQAVIRPMLLDQTRWPTELQAAVEAGIRIPPPTVTAEPTTNRLIISAPESLMPVATALITQLDQPREGVADADVQVIQLRGSRAEAVASSVQSALAARAMFYPGRTMASVVAAPSGTALLVTGTPDQIVHVQTIVKALDTGVAHDDVQVRTVYLKLARAEQVAPMMTELLGQNALTEAERAHRLRFRLPMPNESNGVRVAADERLNAIIIAGRGPELAAAAEMAKQLDSVAGEASTSTVRGVQVVPVRNADPVELAASIEAVFAGTEGDRAPVVRVDRASGTLLIRASADQMKAIDDIVRRVDAAALTSSRRMQMVPIDPSQGSASEIAETLKRMLEQSGSPAVEVITIEELLGETPSEQSSVAWPMSPRFFLAMSAFGAAPTAAEVSIAVDPASNSLVLIGSERAVARVQGLLNDVLSQLPMSPGRLRRIELGDRVDAGRLAGLLSQSMRQVTPPAGRQGDLSRRVSIIVDQDTNALLITATDSDFETITALIQAVAAPADDRAVVVKVYPLVSGGADRAAAHINGLLQGTSRSLQAGRLRNLAVTLLGGEEEVEATFRPSRIHVSADARSGSLVVMAPPEAIPFLDRYVEMMDQSPVITASTLQIFPLEHAEASSLSRTLRSVLRARFNSMSRAGISQLRPEVTADVRTNSLLITADAMQLSEVSELIGQLDAPIGSSMPPLRTIAIKRAKPSQVARLLKQAIVDGRGAKASTTTILADDASGVLLVRADEETSREIDSLLAEIDRDATEEYQVRTIALKRADAATVASALQNLYDDRARISGGGGRRITVIGDAAAKVLLVAASDGDYAALQEIVSRIDSPASGKEIEIRLFPLEHADARDIANEVSGMVWELTYGGMWMFERSGQTQPSSKTVVMHDDRLNALIVTGYGDTFDAVEQVIAILDRPTAAGFARTIKVFPIRSASVDLVRGVLFDLFDTSDRMAGSTRHDMQVRFDAVRRLLVVSGTEEEHAEIKSLIATLDDSGEGESIVQTFALDNARASEAMEILQTSLGLDDRGVARGTIMQDPAGGHPVAVTARIAADARSNALIVTAPERSMAVVASLLTEIDALSPPGEQGVFIIELAHIAPDEIQRVVQAMDLDKEVDSVTGSSVVAEPVTITPLEGRNAVMILASPSDRSTITSIIKSIDVEPVNSRARMQMVVLQNAHASAVVRVLTDILHPANQQSGSPLAEALKEQVRRLSVLGEGVHDADIDLDLTEPIRIIQHESQNAILVSSTPPNVAAIVALVAMLDQLPLTDAVTVRILPLDNIAADEFSRIVNDLFSQGKRLGVRPGSGIQGVPAGILGRALLGDVAMTVDARTNTVIVAGTDEAVATVEILVDRLDSQVASGWLDTTLITLEYADADELSSLLNRVLVDGADDFPGAASMQKQAGRLRMLGVDGTHVVESDVFRPMHELTIVPHETLNALMMIGSQENLDLAVEMVHMLDTEDAAPSATVRFFPLEHASASQVANTVERLFDQQISSGTLDREDRVVVQPDERTNTLVVTTSGRSFSMLEAILESLDAPLSPDFQEIHQVQLENATPSRMASIIQRMMDARLERIRRVDPETADLQRVTVMTDDRTNSLIIAAGQDAFEVVQRLITELDGSELVQRGLVEVIPADRTNASRVASTINAVMQRRYSDVPANVRSAQVPLILVDARSNSLLVSAGPDDLEAIRDLVAKLASAPTDPAIGLHLLPVNGTAQAERLAPRLQQLMRDRQQSLGESATPTDRVSIQSDGGTNSLIVAASRENFEVIEGLLKVLQDAEDLRGTGREVEVITLDVTSASAMVEMLDDLYVNEANRQRGKGSIRVTADERLNAVLVSASSTDVAEIKKLIGRLDGTSPSSVVEIQHVPLTSANALETVRLIEDVISGRSVRGRRRNDRATVLRYVRQAEGTEGGSEMEVSTALRESINLTPDIRTNTIIVKAPSDSMGLLLDMIRDLDESSVGSKKVRIFKLENADAAAMGKMLTDLFRLGQGDDLLVLKPRESVQVADLGGGMIEESANFSGTELTAVPDPRQQLAITVDSRTNSLIVSGTPAYLELVSSVIDELDAIDGNERETFLYQLRNATATSVADVLGDFVETEQQKLIETIGVQQLGSAARLLEREITIRGDDKSNSVLVSASPRYMTRIKEVIKELDVDPPQVLIQVLLAEVTLSGGVDWGVDMSNPGGSFAFDMSLAAFPAGIAGGLPSMTLGISDFSIVLKALENQGRLNILSNPSIIAANNEPATINVGEIIYVPTGAQTFNTGLTSVPLQEKEIGVILSVTPSINPDGYVRMQVEPTLSKLSAQKDQPAVGVETPRIIQRTANTTVTVRDGQTIVIGGLINESYEYQVDKIPILGDIPLIGLLFRSEYEELIRTELVIVLTPHVITSPAAFDRIEELTSRQVDRITLPDELLDQIKDGEIEGMGLFKTDGYTLELQDLEKAIAPEAAEEAPAP